MRLSNPTLILALAALVSARGRFHPTPIPSLPPPGSPSSFPAAAPSQSQLDERSFIDVLNEIHNMGTEPAGLDNELNLRPTHHLTCFSNVPEQTDVMVTAGCYEAGTRCHGSELRIKNCPAGLATCWCVRQYGPG